MSRRDDSKNEFLAIVNSLRHYLLHLKFSGIDRIPLRNTELRERISGEIKNISTAKKKYHDLKYLEEEIENCRRCNLHSTRKHIVFGKGNSNADLVLVGEAPGTDEDFKGEPFIGAAGQLLTRIIQAIGLKRDDVYITNIIKCHPPGNRNPQVDEIEACKPFLVKQLKAIRPRIICALGAFATQTLLETDESISSLRGKFYQFGEIKLMPVYHPAYLLRNPHKKREAWKDMQLIEKEYFGKC